MRDGEELDRLDHFLSERGEAENTRERGQSRQPQQAAHHERIVLYATNSEILVFLRKKDRAEWQSAPGVVLAMGLAATRSFRSEARGAEHHELMAES